MRKSTITKTWVSGLVAMAIGFVIAAVAIGLTFAEGGGTGTYTPVDHGYTFNYVWREGVFSGTMVGIIVAGFLVACAGFIVQLVAWIGALVNSSQLHDKQWFGVMLIAGVFIGLGLVVMIAYVIAAPDAYEEKDTVAGAPR